MINFTTPIQIHPTPSIDHNSIILMLGSCFADNMGKYLQNLRYNVIVNPNGTTYNPMSIARILERLISGIPYDKNDLFHTDNRWISFMHHGSFSSDNEDEVINNINEKYLAAADQLRNATHIILTFGSSYVYERNGKIVNNCHKLPSREFTERQLTVDEIVDKYSVFLPLLRSVNSKAEIIFTVSPVRYLGRGAHAGQINKATLLLAVDEICRLSGNGNISYFPAYEIMMDELRDYRFYSSDMVHPSELAVGYICELFMENLITDNSLSMAKEIEKINKSLAHRPINPDSESHKNFMLNLNKRISELKNKYPNIKF